MKEPPLKPRHLKVSYMQPDSRHRGPPFRVPSPMPYLRLRGRWLDAAGFAIGVGVRVQVSAGRLMIEVLHPSQGTSMAHDSESRV